MKIERDDILCLDDIVFFKLKYKGNFGNSDIYGNDTERYLLDKIKEHKQEPLYKVSFGYIIDKEYKN